MKAIILAAGKGTRLGKYTEGLPKGMLNFAGMTLLERQVRTLKSKNIKNIIIIKGFASEKINIKGVKYIFNKNYANTNMVESLLCARKEFENEDELLICYSDIIYEKQVITKLLQCKADVCVLCDDNWQEYWQARSDNWQEDIESFTYDKENLIIDIGNPDCNISNAMSRFIGIVKLNKDGIKKFLKAYDENRDKYYNIKAQWKHSKSFKQAYMTCMLQELIDRKVKVKAVHISNRWLEFDTVDDYEKACEWYHNNTLTKFIRLENTI